MPDEVIDVSPASGEVPKELISLRTGLYQVPLETLQVGLAQFKEKRDAFRDWLKSQLREGVHFGFAPGTEPKYSPDGKSVMVWSKNGEKPVPLTQWTPKQSLYKAGADFLCELLGAIDKYEADMDSWKQAGSREGMFVQKCVLYSRNDPTQIVGEGRGIYSVGEKRMTANAAIKMAKKSSKIDAVINWLGLSDLFTQDLEDGTERKDESPDEDHTKPPVAPRGDRCTGAAIKRLVDRWKERNPNGTVEDWAEYVAVNCGRRFNVRAASEWTESDAMSIDAALKVI